MQPVPSLSPSSAVLTPCQHRRGCFALGPAPRNGGESRDSSFSLSSQIPGSLLLSPAHFVHQGARLIGVSFGVSHPCQLTSLCLQLWSPPSPPQHTDAKILINCCFSKGFHPSPRLKNHPRDFFVLLGPCNLLGSAIKFLLPFPGAMSTHSIALPKTFGP